MLRVLVRTDDANMAANVGGSVEVTHKTFLIEAHELEAYLRQKISSLAYRQVVGIELVDAAQQENGNG